MDALSDLFRMIRLSGGLFLDAEFSAPWCVASQVEPEDCAASMPVPARIIALHYILSGRVLLEVAGEPPVELPAGAIVLLPRNDPHLLASEPGLEAVEAAALIQAGTDGGLARLRHGGGGEHARFVCGFVGTDAPRHPLLDALPSALVLDLNGKPAGDWVATSFRHAAAELAAHRAGAAIVLARLAELLFIEAVRHYVETLPEDRRGLLAGLRDRAVGKALALMHAEPARGWTAEEFAARVFLSRSAFAERFTGLVGMPPMSYLTAWRMQLAAERLATSGRPLAQIAAEVGYESEAAFSRAFKREFGASPAAARAAARRGAAGGTVAGTGPGTSPGAGG